MQAYTEDVKAYSSIAAKWAQRVVNAFAAQNNCVLFSMGISVALLKKITFEDIAKEIGISLRSVQFDFPPAEDVWVRRKRPGMADYGNVNEILNLLKAIW
eukprot:12896134-Prorocentrum_lima.AAC.1